MRIIESADELLAATGSELGASGWHLVDQARVDAFAEITGDHQWIHVDPDRAADGPFGGTVAHGFLTLSLLPVLVSEIQRVPGARLAVNYGLNRVRFPAPLRTGSRVRATATLLDAQRVDGDGGVQCVTRVSVEGEGAPKPCCVAELVTRYFF
ncbi:MAG: MaoC family dehydratase [Actinocatenispora sp.]